MNSGVGAFKQHVVPPGGVSGLLFAVAEHPALNDCQPSPVKNGDLEAWIREEGAMRSQSLLTVAGDLHGLQNGSEIAAYNPFIGCNNLGKTH